MGKDVYKVLDDKGRTTIPLIYRKAIGISSGEVIRIAPDENGSCLNLSKAEVVDFDSEDPEITQACIHAAVRTLSMGQKLELAASLLSLMSERKIAVWRKGC